MIVHDFRPLAARVLCISTVFPLHLSSTKRAKFLVIIDIFSYSAAPNQPVNSGLKSLLFNKIIILIL